MSEINVDSVQSFASNSPIRILENANAREWLDTRINRSAANDKAAETIVREIIDDVHARGDAALKEYTSRFDHVNLDHFELPHDELVKARKRISPALESALCHAAENIREYHERQLRQGFIETRTDGAILGQRIIPLQRVGIYVPGGTALYPSSVLMNAVPAKVAGVDEVVMLTPPPKTSDGADLLLAAADIAKVDRVFTLGGAQAIAALAYGTESVPRVDKITGPGNLFVATAKRLVYGQVDIDMVAGPSEILIIADDTATPAFLAADLLAQAEHDKLASAVLLTTSRRIARETAAETERQLSLLHRKDIAAASLANFGAIIICDSIDDALALANTIAPEHLEIVTESPMSLLGRVRNAGSIFLGSYTPESLGDYMAGTNHVLPTGGSARFFSPLSVDAFIKKSSFICFDKASLSSMANNISLIANAEKLDAHARSAAIRFD